MAKTPEYCPHCDEWHVFTANNHCTGCGSYKYYFGDDDEFDEYGPGSGGTGHGDISWSDADPGL